MTKRSSNKSRTAKPLVRLMLSTKVINYFKSKGPDWQTRMDRVLMDIVEAAEQNR